MNVLLPHLMAPPFPPIPPFALPFCKGAPVFLRETVAILHATVLQTIHLVQVSIINSNWHLVQMQSKILNLHMLQSFIQCKSAFLKKEKKFYCYLRTQLLTSSPRSPAETCTPEGQCSWAISLAAAFTCRPSALCNSLKHCNFRLLFLIKPNQTREKWVFKYLPRPPRITSVHWEHATWASLLMNNSPNSAGCLCFSFKVFCHRNWLFFSPQVSGLPASHINPTLSPKAEQEAHGTRREEAAERFLAGFGNQSLSFGFTLQKMLKPHIYFNQSSTINYYYYCCC